MKQAVLTMLNMQNAMNLKVHPQWVEQNFAWNRAIWVECAELMNHYGYKWWKKQIPELEQVQLEIVDIWHFGLSALFDGRSMEAIAESIVTDIQAINAATAGETTDDVLGVLDSAEAVATTTLTEGFSVAVFWQLVLAAELNFDSLYQQYIGKNVLNFFRQDNGYKEGSYNKIWQGREDNEHLVELIKTMDSSSSDYPDQLYQALVKRYTVDSH